MRALTTSLTLLILCSACTQVAVNQASSFDCPVTPTYQIVQEMADAAGTYPVWIVDGSFGQWNGPNFRVKTAWILARERAGDLTATARRLDADDIAQFSRGMSDALYDELLIPDAQTIQMIPGGADEQTVKRYSFHSSGMIYPSPGCWEILAHYGESEVRIILLLKVGVEMPSNNLPEVGYRPPPG